MPVIGKSATAAGGIQRPAHRSPRACKPAALTRPWGTHGAWTSLGGWLALAGAIPYRASLLALGFVGLGILSTNAQGPVLGRVKDFTAPEYYPPPRQNQMRSLLKGAEAEPRPDGSYALRTVQLETFRETGEREVFIRADSCVYDATRRMAHSTGTLELEAADGTLRITGEGFAWRQTEGRLTISNRVHATLHTNAPQAGVRRVIAITADRFDFDVASQQGRYQGQVRVTEQVGGEARIELAGERLTVQLLGRESFQELTAEGDVRIQQNDLQGRADRAVYQADREVATLTGRVQWQQGAREGQSDSLRLEREGNRLVAAGAVRLRLPRAEVGLPTWAALAGKPASSPATAEWLTVTAGRLVSWERIAVFRDDVRVTDDRDPPGVLSANEIQIERGVGATLARVVAEGNVVVAQTPVHLTASKLIYTPTNTMLELRGNPTWALADRQGRGDALMIRFADQSLEARGNGQVTVPRPAGARSLVRWPGRELPTDDPGSHATPGRLQIQSRSYEIQPARMAFEGDVRVEDFQGDQLAGRLTCQSLAVYWDQENQGVRQLIAQEQVRLERPPPAGEATPPAAPTLSCGRLILQLAGPDGRLESAAAENGVDFQDGEIRGRGARADYRTRNGRAVVELTGQPEVRTASFAVVGADVLLWDVVGNWFQGRGPYQIRPLTNAPAQPPESLRRKKTGPPSP